MDGNLHNTSQYLRKPRNLRLQSCCWADTPGWGGGSCQVLHNSDFTRYFKFTPLAAFFIKALAPLPAHSCSSLLDVSRRFSSSYKPCFLIHLQIFLYRMGAPGILQVYFKFGEYCSSTQGSLWVSYPSVIAGITPHLFPGSATPPPHRDGFLPLPISYIPSFPTIPHFPHLLCIP